MGGLFVENRPEIRRHRTLALTDLTGIIPPMLTPFCEDGEVDYNAFGRNIERWNNTPLSGYLVLGSNSETVYLDEGEKLKLIELTVQAAAKDKKILAGTGLESTRATIHFTNKAALLGAEAALVLTPSFYGGQMSDRILINHFTAVADTAEIPLLIYNVPKFTHINISAEAVRVLSQHPNIIGMKDSLGDVDQLKRFKEIVSAEFILIVGTASALYPALNLGIRAGILALANCAPNDCAEIQRLHKQGAHQEAQELHARMLPVNKAITETYGVAGLKYAASLVGYEGGYPRSPLRALDEQARVEIRAILEEAGLL